jgi:hypothetical protein
VSQFTWAVPEFPSERFWDLYLELSDGRMILLPLMINLDTITTPIPPGVIVETQDRMMTCQRGGACGEALIGAVPFLGTLAALAGGEQLYCLAEYSYENGHYSLASTFRFLDHLNLVETAEGAYSDALHIIGLAGHSSLLSVLPGAVYAAGVCVTEGFFWQHLGLREEPGQFASDLADSVLVAFPQTTLSFSNEVFVEGRSAVRVIVEGDTAQYVTTADSVGIENVFVTALPNHNLSWTHIGRMPIPLGTDEINPHEVSVVEVRPDSTDTLTVVLLHRLADSSIVKIEYPPLTTQDGTVARLWLADSSATVQMEVDLDGDGTVDFLWYPGAAGVEGEASPPGPGEPALSLASAQNPT